MDLGNIHKLGLLNILGAGGRLASRTEGDLRSRSQGFLGATQGMLQNGHLEPRRGARALQRGQRLWASAVADNLRYGDSSKSAQDDMGFELVIAG